MPNPLPVISFRDSDDNVTTQPIGRYKHQIVLPCEDEDDYEALQTRLQGGFAPEGQAEQLLVRNLATAQWLSDRLLTVVTGDYRRFYRTFALPEGASDVEIQASATIEGDGDKETIRKSYRDWCRFQGVMLRTLRALEVRQVQRRKGLGGDGQPGSSGGCGGGLRNRNGAAPKPEAVEAPPLPVAAEAPAPPPVPPHPEPAAPQARPRRLGNQHLLGVDDRDASSKAAEIRPVTSPHSSVPPITGGSNQAEIRKNSGLPTERPPIPAGHFPVWVNSGGYPVYPAETGGSGTMVGSG